MTNGGKNKSVAFIILFSIECDICIYCHFTMASNRTINNLKFDFKKSVNISEYTVHVYNQECLSVSSQIF